MYNEKQNVTEIQTIRPVTTNDCCCALKQQYIGNCVRAVISGVKARLGILVTATSVETHLCLM